MDARRDVGVGGGMGRLFRPRNNNGDQGGNNRRGAPPLPLPSPYFFPLLPLLLPSPYPSPCALDATPPR